MVKTKVWLINVQKPYQANLQKKKTQYDVTTTACCPKCNDICPTLWIQWLWDILGKLSTHFVDLILMHSQSVSLGLLQFHMCSKKLALWESRTVKKTSMVGIKAWCVHRCRINFKTWYVFLGITLFSLTYPFLGGTCQKA